MKNKFLFKSLKNTKLNIFIIIFLCFISSYLTAQIPLYIKYGIDEVMYKDTANIPSFLIKLFKFKSMEEKLIIICLIIFIINLILCAINYLKNKQTTKFNVRINNNVKSEILNKTMNLKYNSFKKYNNSEILQRVDIDSNTYTSFFDTNLIMLIDVFGTIIFSLFNSFKLNIMITLYALICIIIMFIASLVYFNKIKQLANRKVSDNENIISFLSSYIKNIKIIKMYNKEDESSKKIVNYIRKYKNSSYKMADSTNKYNGLCHLINVTRDAVVVTIGGVFVASGKLSFGSLTALFTYVSQVLEGARSITIKLKDIGEVYVAYKRLSDFLKLEDDRKLERNSFYGDIIFDNVTIFINDRIILKNVNFKIDEGKKYVLIGDNGSGKSVLLKTLLGLYKYTGNIYIGERNIKDLNTSDIITNIGYVNDEYLFNISIEENICLGKSNLKMQEYSKKVSIYDDILNFESGYKTIVNENINLSGGQKERIALARALYRENKYYLFDNCLKRLDSNTKDLILDNLLKEKFTFIMANLDYDVARRINNVLFIKDNTIIQSTHDKLYEIDHYYKELIDIDRNTLGEEYE